MSISSKAMLVSLSINLWTARRVDQKATQTVIDRHKVDRGAGRYNKCLINTEADVFRAVQQAATEAREWHYAHTLPWAHKGAQILPAAEYLEYADRMRQYREGFEEAVAKFVRDYPALKAEARRKLNGLFREDEYPSPREIERKYGFEYTFLPVPDAGNVLIDMVTKDVTAKVKADTERTVREATEQAMRDLWERLHEPVKNMAVALADPERRFHDTLVENVREVVEVLPRLNLTDDPQLAAMGEEVKKALTKHRPQTLRDDGAKRAAAARRAKELTEKMAAFMR
jgi:hypothetical protein